ncbi:hypothetical protein HAV22_12430 [Massilia sp. TW-1]|uniref:Uncharacterized protein n=1 Tax=Telluria antibiotica TaxID=2717319 RepID=A0ABX0PAU1_9BURK|nr:hypothetical protein [Telluria antibiotica]NIA54440.1 hypothetical protein [Telluria antibiotica]
MLSGLCGCALTAPPYSLNKLGAQRVLVVEPVHDVMVRLDSGVWSVGPSAAGIKADEHLLRPALIGWDDDVLGAFTNELVRGLEARGYAVRHVQQRELEGVLARRDDNLHRTIVVRSYIKAGFTYGTPIDRSLRPFMNFALGYEFGDGRRIGERSFTISARPMGPVVDRFAPLDDYSVPNVEALEHDRARHIAALHALAAQAAGQVLKDTFY